MNLIEKNHPQKFAINRIVFCFFLVAFILPSVTNAQYFYVERFNTQANGTTSDSDNTPWTTIQGSSGSLSVDSNFEDMTAASVGSEAVWSSGVITISGSTSLSVDAFEYSDSEASDYIHIFYKLDGSTTEVQFGNFSGNFTSGTANNTLTRTNVGIDIRFLNNFENHTIDNVIVESTSTSSTLYSIASGDWDLGTTWSETGYAGAACNCYPNGTSVVNVGNGRTVNLNVDADVNDITIENTATVLYTSDYVEMNMLNDGVFTINSGGTFDENGQIASDLDFEGGSGTSQLVVNSGSSFDIDRLYMFGTNSLNINGAGDINLSTSLNFRSAGTVTNDLSGTMTIGDEITFNTDNATFVNNETIYLTNDFLILNSGNTGNLFSNTGRIDIGGDINLADGDITINNTGVINQYGNFVNIDTGSDFNNLGGSTWAWYYVGTYDTDINTIFSAGGLFEYEGFGDQLVIPVQYNNLTIDGSGSKTLQANTTVSGVLHMTASYISLGDYNLIIGNSGSVINGNSSSFILTDGTGQLIQNNIGSTGKTGNIVFPIGINTSSYTPITLSNAGTADTFSARICSGIYEEGGCATGTVASSLVVDKTWFISESVAGGSNATLTFQWNSGNELTGFNRTDLNIIHHNGSIWEALASTAASGSGPYTATVSGVSSFSPFGIEGGESPLPVELTYFDAALTNDKVKLTWETASELNNDFFTVEKSQDLESFYEVAVMAGKGTTNEQNKYLTFDHNPVAGVSYYRLKQTDFDGTVSYSKLVQIDYNTGTDKFLTLYPVPSKGNGIKLAIEGMPINRLPVIVTDIQGRVVYENILSSQNTEVQLDFKRKLSRGVYLLKINAPEPISKYFVVE